MVQVLSLKVNRKLAQKKLKDQRSNEIKLVCHIVHFFRFSV